jgi:hypothetical protein
MHNIKTTTSSLKASISACKAIIYLAVVVPALSAYYQVQCITIKIHSDVQSYAMLRFDAGDFKRYAQKEFSCNNIAA